MNHGTLYALLLKSGIADHEWALFIFMYVIFTVQAFLFNRLINQFEVLYKPSNIPVILFIILYALMPDFLSLNPFLIVNILLPVVLWKIFALYKSERPITGAFDTGFFTSLMILVYQPMILMLVFLYISIAILRPFNLREWIATLMGVVTPFILLFTILILTGYNNLMFSNGDGLEWVPVIKLQTLNWHHILSASIICLILLLSFIKLYSNYNKNVIRMRKFQICFMLLMVFLLIIVLLPIQHSPARFNLLIAPTTLFMSYYFIAIKKVWWFELLSLLLITLCCINYIIS